MVSKITFESVKDERQTISVIVPAYLEAQNLPFLTKRLEKTLDGVNHEIILSIDSNADGSFKVAHQLKEQYDTVRTVLSKERRGKTRAIVEGFRASEGDTIVIIDADLQYPPEAITQLAKRIGPYDVVNGKRVERDDKVIRKVESETYNLLTSTLFNGSFKDNDSGLKAFRRRAFKDLIPYLRERWHRYFLVLSAERGYRVTEEPIPHAPRKRGFSKFGASPMKLFRGFVDLISVKQLTSSVYFKGALGLEHLLRRVRKLEGMHGRIEELPTLSEKKLESYGLITPFTSPDLRVLK